jgi:mRNA interferase RelE/StbE
MAFEIILAPGPARSLKRLPACVRAWVKDAIERHLRHEPRKVSKSRITLMRGLRQPQCRLRVGDIRVFYDGADTDVEILAIVTKAQAQGWLEERGTEDTAGVLIGLASEDQWPVGPLGVAVSASRRRDLAA